MSSKRPRQRLGLATRLEPLLAEADEGAVRMFRRFFNPATPFSFEIMNVPAWGSVSGFLIGVRFQLNEGRGILRRHRAPVGKMYVFAVKRHGVIGHMGILSVLAHDVLHQSFELSRR